MDVLLSERKPLATLLIGGHMLKAKGKHTLMQSYWKKLLFRMMSGWIITTTINNIVRTIALIGS